MTVQVHDLAVQQTPNGWRMSHVPHRGGAGFHLLDEAGKRLRSLDLGSALPGFLRFAQSSTAGMIWTQHLLAYFTARQQHFVARAWWGGRLVVALGALRPIDPGPLADELHRTECELVLRGLRELVAETDGGARPEYVRPPDDLTRCTVGTLVHFPGLLGLSEAVPLLRVLEERLGPSGEVWGGFRYYPCETRHLAQLSLRRLGQRPRGFPPLVFTASEPRPELRVPQPGPIDGPTRHASLRRVGQGTPLAEVYRLLGSPGEIGWWDKRKFWRYDVDADEPYTALVWLAEGDDVVTRVVRLLPPLWTGPEVCPDRPHPLLASDGDIRSECLKSLADGAFAGTRVEVDVLRAVATAGRDPMAALARGVLDGRHDALGPLCDALEEAADPRAAEVRDGYQV